MSFDKNGQQIREREQIRFCRLKVLTALVNFLLAKKVAEKNDLLYP